MSVVYPDGWLFTDHALQRMDEMGLCVSQIRAVLEGYELRYPGRDGPGGPPREVRVADRLAVVVVPTERVVITVLWHLAECRTYYPPVRVSV